jgi:hypothetical protein
LQAGLAGPSLGIVEDGRDVRVARRNGSAPPETLDSTASACDEVADRKTSCVVNREETDSSVARRQPDPSTRVVSWLIGAQSLGWAFISQTSSRRRASRLRIARDDSNCLRTGPVDPSS